MLISQEFENEILKSLATWLTWASHMSSCQRHQTMQPRSTLITDGQNRTYSHKQNIVVANSGKLNSSDALSKELYLVDANCSHSLEITMARIHQAHYQKQRFAKQIIPSAAA